MKITLISPYQYLQAFGIRTISACLKRERHDVHLLFLPKPFTERYENKTLNEIVKLSKESNMIVLSRLSLVKEMICFAYIALIYFKFFLRRR